MTSTPRPLADILTHCTSIRRLQRRADEQARLLAKVRSLLPPPVDSHCVCADWTDKGLVLVADAPVWATRLRFLAPRVAESLPELPAKTSVQVKVWPTDALPARPRDGRKLQLSARNARMLRQLADAVLDPELSRALKRLSLRGRETTG